MKITGGWLKGRSIKVPRNPNIRPSTEKTREAIFSSLGNDIIDADVADLFCGSGALGFEALSRGAQRALFVESDSQTAATVRENIKSFELADRGKIINLSVFSLRKSHFKEIDIIFADPPYRGGYAEKLLLFLQKFDWCGILVLEHDAEWRHKSDEYKLVKRIDFGDTAVSMLLRNRDFAPGNGDKKG